MIHPHQAFLDELAFAIRHFVPTLPKEIKDEAEIELEKMKSNPEVDEKTISEAFHDIGVREYPYRRAYIELIHGKAEDEMNALVLEHVEPNVREIIKPHLDSGVSLDELIASEMFFTQLTPEQQYQIEDGILVARSKLADQLKEHVTAESEIYRQLIEKWKIETEKIREAIARLEALASDSDENQKREILNKAARYREGFLITERDPDLKEIEKEIEYWQETFHPVE